VIHAAAAVRVEEPSKLAAVLRAMGHRVAVSSIPKLLVELRHGRQIDRKTKEGSHCKRHPPANRLMITADGLKWCSCPAMEDQAASQHAPGISK
jgi:hypothetical protein